MCLERGCHQSPILRRKKVLILLTDSYGGRSTRRSTRVVQTGKVAVKKPLKSGLSQTVGDRRSQTFAEIPKRRRQRGTVWRQCLHCLSYSV